MKTIQEICETLLEHISECEEREYCDGNDLYIFETGIESMMEYLQSAQEVIDDMKECVGAGGEFMDKKLEEWIERLQ